jgi:hypothetical protein
VEPGEGNGVTTEPVDLDVVDEDLSRFRFNVLGRYRTKLPDNEPHVTVHVQTGRDERFTHCGTLTMSETEWESFFGALLETLGDRVEIDDHRP